ncbi:MAG: aldehyde reductase [Cryobacterium sp.]|nr:aldehyde reductase [Cryobacterium sp.]
MGDSKLNSASMSNKDDQVLVTGGSGFLGVHCVAALLNEGFKVRTTIRDLKRESEVLAMLDRAGVDPNGRLEFAKAELLSDSGWAAAAEGCRFVLHVASPFPAREPKDENEIIRPAREGALRVLAAARDAGAERVVLTSSFAAIGYGKPPIDRPYTEEDWTDPSGKVSTYVKSKTLAEQAAWDFIEREGGKLQLAVVNPVGILGPVLGKDLSTSIDLVLRLLKGKVPGLPKMSFGLVDVRDVADLHIRAMTNPAANGERFLAVADEVMLIPDVARILREDLGAAANRVPKLVLPDLLVKLAAVFDPSLKDVADRLGNHREVSNAKAKKLLGWKPRSNEELILATAQSLIDLGLVPGGQTA